MILLVACAAASTTGTPPSARPLAPITEVSHPDYVDGAGVPLRWTELRGRARGTEERALVRRRQLGRTVLRVAFAGATAVEVWGGARLLESESWVAWPVFAQAAFTGTCAVLTWTRLPGDRAEDRAMLLDGVNTSLR